MNKRKQAAVIRFTKYSKRTDPTNWYRAQLMLYYPWYDEQIDLLGGYETFQQHYNPLYLTIRRNNTDIAGAEEAAF